MGKIRTFDEGKVLSSKIIRQKEVVWTWIIYESQKDGTNKVIEFDGIVHCKTGDHIIVYYSDTRYFIVIEKTEKWEKAMALFSEEYGLYFKNYKSLSDENIRRLKEENPAADKDGEFYLKAEGLTLIKASKIWNKNEDVIWHEIK